MNRQKILGPRPYLSNLQYDFEKVLTIIERQHRKMMFKMLAQMSSRRGYG